MTPPSQRRRGRTGCTARCSSSRPTTARRLGGGQQTHLTKLRRTHAPRPHFRHHHVPDRHCRFRGQVHAGSQPCRSADRGRFALPDDLRGSARAPLLFTGRKWAAVPTLVLTVVALLVEVPLFAADRPAGHSVPIRLLTFNAYQGSADPEAMVAAASRSADVFLVQELTPDLADKLVLGGLEHEFPYRAVDARPWAHGVGIWSRYPILHSNRIPNTNSGSSRPPSGYRALRTT